MNAKILHILPVIAFIIFFIILAGVFIAFILLPNYIENLDGIQDYDNGLE